MVGDGGLGLLSQLYEVLLCVSFSVLQCGLLLVSDVKSFGGGLGLLSQLYEVLLCVSVFTVLVLNVKS